MLDKLAHVLTQKSLAFPLPPFLNRFHGKNLLFPSIFEGKSCTKIHFINILLGVCVVPIGEHI